MKQKKKQFIKILIIVSSIFLLVIAYNVHAEYTVYITNYGSKYHRSGCQYLSESKIAIDIDDAKARGYTACSRCHPDSYISTSNTTNTTNSTSSSTYKITSNYTTNPKSATSTLNTTANIENTVSNSSTFSAGEIVIFIIFGIPFAISLISVIIEDISEIVSAITSKFKKKKATEISSNFELPQCEVCGKYTNELKKGVCPECYNEIMDRLKNKSAKRTLHKPKV